MNGGFEKRGFEKQDFGERTEAFKKGGVVSKRGFGERGFHHILGLDRGERACEHSPDLLGGRNARGHVGRHVHAGGRKLRAPAGGAG
eukprot:3749607-Rhodomonas_salina.1